MAHALVACVSWESRQWNVDDYSVLGTSARVPFHIRQVRSWNCVKRDGRMGPGLDFRARRDRYSCADFRPRLFFRLLVPSEATPSLDHGSFRVVGETSGLHSLTGWAKGYGSFSES